MGSCCVKSPVQVPGHRQYLNTASIHHRYLNTSLNHLTGSLTSCSSSEDGSLTSCPSSEDELIDVAETEAISMTVSAETTEEQGTGLIQPYDSSRPIVYEDSMDYLHPTEYTQKALYDACGSGDKEKIFKLQAKFPALLTRNSNQCLLRTAESGNTACFIAIESLLFKGKVEEERQQYIAGIVDANKENLLHKACRSGSVEMFSYICDRYLSLVESTDKTSLLEISYELNNKDVLELLLKSK